MTHTGSGAAPRDDPATCVEPSVAEAEAQKRIDAALSKLEACTAKLEVRGRAALGLERKASGRAHVLVGRSSVRDCKVLACLKRGLESVELPPLDPDQAEYFTVVALEPHAAPRNEPHADLGGLVDAKDCTDPTPLHGTLPPEQIQSVVRSHSDQFRPCFEGGLGQNPALVGRLEVRFLIDREGKVNGARVVGNTIPDCAVAHCVRDAYRTFVFPKPEHGPVTVVYPLVLEPD